jgi:hypothetical protein
MSKPELVNYVIESIRDMQTEINYAERDRKQKKGGRRRSRKKASDDEVDETETD